MIHVLIRKNETDHFRKSVLCLLCLEEALRKEKNETAHFGEASLYAAIQIPGHINAIPSPFVPVCAVLSNRLALKHFQLH